MFDRRRAARKFVFQVVKGGGARNTFKRLVIALSFRTLKVVQKFKQNVSNIQNDSPSWEISATTAAIVGGGVLVSRPRPGMVDIRGFPNGTAYRRHTRISSALDPNFSTLPSTTPPVMYRPWGSRAPQPLTYVGARVARQDYNIHIRNS